MERYCFLKNIVDGHVHICAIENGWSMTYSPDGERDALQIPGGKKISQLEAEKILNEYGWEICEKCGEIYKLGEECSACIVEEYMQQ